MKRSFWVWNLLLCVAVLFSCQRSKKLIREKFQSLKGRDEVTFVVFGDSISGGRGFSVTGTSYGSFMKPMLAELLGSRVSIINSCKVGETYKTAVRRIQEDILSYRPDVVFIMLGMVDSTTRGLIEPVFEKQVRDFYKLLQEYDVYVIVLTSTGFKDIKIKRDFRYERLKEFNDITAFSAAYYHFPVIDVSAYMEKLLKTDPDEYRSMFNDLIHLNEKGQKFVAEYIVESIADALKNHDRL